MSRFRFSLLGLAGLVALVALGCAAIVYASPLVSGVAWSATFLILAFATLAAAVRTPPNRYWWLGFVIFGWLHLLTMFGPFAGLSDRLQIQTLLGTTAMVMPKATKTIQMTTPGGFVGMAPEGMSGEYGGMMPGGTGMGGLGMAAGTIQTQDTQYILAFISTSQALLTLLLAFLGGFAGRWMYERNRSPVGE